MSTISMSERVCRAIYVIGLIAAATVISSTLVACADEQNKSSSSGAQTSSEGTEGEGGGPDAPMVDAPDLTGESADSAQDELESLGLTVSYEIEPEDPSICEVVGQDEIGEVEPNITVTLTVECTPPEVIGMGIDEATSELESIGFAVALAYEEPPYTAECEVTSQDPETSVEPDAEIMLDFECEIPDVTGESLSDAESTLEDAGFEAGWSVLVDDTYECKVSDQDPIGSAPPGETIDLEAECPEEDSYGY